MQLAGLRLPGQLAEATAEHLLLLDIDALGAEKDDVALSDQDGEVADELVAVGRSEKIGELYAAAGELGAQCDGGLEVVVFEKGRGGGERGEGSGKGVARRGCGSVIAGFSGDGLELFGNVAGAGDGDFDGGCGRRHCEEFVVKKTL